MKLRLFTLVLCTVGISVSRGMELANDQDLQKIPSSIQHLPQDVTVSIFGFGDYPTLASSRRVCKLWKTLIDEKLPLSQRYILKYLAQFVQKKSSERTIKIFEKIFLASPSNESMDKTILDDIIEELQDDLSVTKDQAYQALWDNKLMSTRPSIELEIYVGGKLNAKRKFAFSYIPINLFKHMVDQDVQLVITGQPDSFMQIFGIGNLPATVLDRVTEVKLCQINLLKIPKQLQKLQRLVQFNLINSKLSSIPAELWQLTKLQKLYLDNNQLSSIPVEIGQLTNLLELYLSNNQLSSIPAEIRQLSNLEGLSLYNNRLSGIPAEVKEALSNCYIKI